MRMSLVSILVLALMVATAVPRAHAQSPHAAPQAALDAALSQHVASADADRAAVRRVLDHPEVRAVAQRVGLDVRRAADAVATLQGSQLSEAAAHARQIEDSLAGGQSRVVISTTVIIIALLVLILIIVAVD